MGTRDHWTNAEPTWTDAQVRLLFDADACLRTWTSGVDVLDGDVRTETLVSGDMERLADRLDRLWEWLDFFLDCASRADAQAWLTGEDGLPAVAPGDLPGLIERAKLPGDVLDLLSLIRHEITVTSMDITTFYAYATRLYESPELFPLDDDQHGPDDVTGPPPA